jgi:hypothetical protein
MSLEETARGLIVAMQPRGGTEPYDTSATVLRVEGGTLWVHIPGGAEETPVQKTINASPGDTIQIRVGGGTAWAVGNATAPPTDDATANAAHQVAEAADGKAEEALEIAKVKIGWAEIDQLFAEDITATGSFEVDNGVWNLTQGTTGMELASADGNTSMSVVDGDLTIAMTQSDGTLARLTVQNDADTNDPVAIVQATKTVTTPRPMIEQASVNVRPDGIDLTGGVTADTLTVSGYDVGETLDTLTGQITYQSGVSLKSLAPGIHIVTNATDTPPYTPWTSWVCIVAGLSSGQTTKIIARPLSVETGTWEIHRVSGTWGDWRETGRTYPLTGNLSTATSIRKPGPPTYGSVLITGTVGGIGGVVIAVTISNGAIGSIRNVMTGAAWSNTNLTITYGVTNNVGYLTFKTTSALNSNICIIGG